MAAVVVLTVAAAEVFTEVAAADCAGEDSPAEATTVVAATPEVPTLATAMAVTTAADRMLAVGSVVCVEVL